MSAAGIWDACAAKRALAGSVASTSVVLTMVAGGDVAAVLRGVTAGDVPTPATIGNQLAVHGRIKVS